MEIQHGHFIDSNAFHIFESNTIFSRMDVSTYKSALDLVAREKPRCIQLLPSGIYVVPDLFAMAVSVGTDDNFIFYNH